MPTKWMGRVSAGSKRRVMTAAQYRAPRRARSRAKLLEVEPLKYPPRNGLGRIRSSAGWSAGGQARHRGGIVEQATNGSVEPFHRELGLRQMNGRARIGPRSGVVYLVTRCRRRERDEDRRETPREQLRCCLSPGARQREVGGSV